MSLLAPLYIAGLVALSLPVLFHLIRRAPQGRQAFSSLMFLSPSPPRLTRRSRLTNIILLLLRAAALALLALAFARPFFQRKAEAGASRAEGRRVALLVDSSASMRRGDLWAQAAKHVEQVLRDLGPADEVGLFFFDRRVRPGMTFAEWNELAPSRRAAVLRSRVAETRPSWAATHAGEAVATVADLLAEAESPRTSAGSRGRQLVLISDLQQGSHMEALQGHQWPQNVLLDVRPVAPPQSTNASLQLVRNAADDDDRGGADAADARLRVRVTNHAGSEREQFTLAWAGAGGVPAGTEPVTVRAPPRADGQTRRQEAAAGTEPVTVYVPAGRSQVVRVPWPAAGEGAHRLALTADDADFDNTLFVVPPRKDVVRVIYAGDDAAGDVNGLRFYLERAVADDSRRTVEFLARGAAAPLTDADLSRARLVIVSASDVPPDRAAALRRFAQGGGNVLWVLTDAAAGESLARVMRAEGLRVREAPARDFALIGRVDSEHPLFAPFAAARLSDFTRIHFWKHRSVTLPEPTAGARVLAAFDDGDPFLIEQSIGRGRLVVATSGWHPADSQLALSTKFVPLMDGFVRRRDGAAAEAQYSVGDPIPLAEPVAREPPRVVVTPGGRRVDLAADARAFDATDEPGVYRLAIGGTESPVAVNVAPDESRTAPLAVEDLERWGARVGNRLVPEEIVTRERQVRRVELEGRQKVWQWLIVGVLALLAAETALAGRLARRAQKRQVTP